MFVNKAVGNARRRVILCLSASLPLCLSASLVPEF